MNTLRKLFDAVGWLPGGSVLYDKLLGMAMGNAAATTKTGPSYQVFPHVRVVRFREMEYTVPAEAGPACVREILRTIREKKIPICFQMLYSRSIGCEGILTYSYAATNSGADSNAGFYDYILANVFQDVATPPVMSWKTSPTGGYLRGTVTDSSSGDPIYNADVTTVYQTNPHIDTKQQALHCARLIIRQVRGEIRPRTAIRMPPLLVNILNQVTSDSPMRDLLQIADEQRRRPGVLSVSIVEGYPYADVADGDVVHRGDRRRFRPCRRPVTAGATSVQFSAPVVTYVENFVDFPVGGIVPLGYYDRPRAAWVPSDNGRVIKILSITGGLADLDINGSGTPAGASALAALGVSDAERQQLATIYTPGQGLWRMPLPHFRPDFLA